MFSKSDELMKINSCIAVMCIITVLFLFMASCILPLICGRTMQLLNKTIFKLPWIKFGGAILDGRMFTLFYFIFCDDHESVPFSHSV